MMYDLKKLSSLNKRMDMWLHQQKNPAVFFTSKKKKHMKKENSNI